MYGITSVVAVLSLLTICECIPPYGSTDYGYSSGSHDEDYHHEPKPYAFGYSVKDFKKGTNFNQHESSDGHTIKGQYAVALPDGRMQIVSYNADWKNGYHADVKYVGEAHHPELYASTYGTHDIGGGSSYDYGSQASSTNFQSLGAAGIANGGYNTLKSAGSYGGHQGYRK